MIDMDTRLRTARGIAKSETEASTEVFETLKRRGHPDAPPPPTVLDGWGGIAESMVECRPIRVGGDRRRRSDPSQVGSTCRW